jgi:hypothetical protein
VIQAFGTPDPTCAPDSSLNLAMMYWVQANLREHHAWTGTGDGHAAPGQSE